MEHLIGILLCRENPSAQLIRPTQGDGGIDVLIPIEQDDRFIDVYQVKKFATNLTTDQKGQVKSSLKRLVSFATDQKYRIRNWYATMPLSRTNDYLDWLADTATEVGATFRCEWRGLAFLEGLASKYPEVIDYYLKDGKDRLDRSMTALIEILRQRDSIDRSLGAEPYGPSDAVPGLMAIHEAINRDDPHYRYDIAVSHDRPDVAEEPWLVAAVQKSTPQRCVTVKIFARCKQSVIERPIPIQISILADPGSDLERKIDAFDKYGQPLRTQGQGVLSGIARFPGGFEFDLSGGSASITPVSRPEDAYRLRMQVIDPSGHVIAAAMLDMEPVSQGLSGRGVRAYGVHEERVFSIELLTDLETERLSFTIGMKELTGKVPEVVLPGLKLLSNFRAPNLLRFASPYGPVYHAGEPIPDEAEQIDDLEAVLAVVSSLAVIQNYTTVQLQVPDLSQIDMREVRTLIEIAALLRDGSLPIQWTSFLAHASDEPTDEVFQIIVDQPLSIVANGISVLLGYRRIHFPEAQVDRSVAPVEHDGHFDIVLVPPANSDARASFIFIPPISV
ncbi:hypothetical protein [Cryptosporangium sp. NPDC051539]|uniref:hypothetical protein n=1 Tax=Cryptosporangium sp. NPDC051539 TaxID=3363962 RepID=UPI0037963AEA